MRIGARSGTVDRATLIGVLGGGITSVSALVGYFVIPLTRGQHTESSLAMMGVNTVVGSPYSYHVIVLGIPSFLAAFLGSLLARRWRIASRATDLKIVSGIIFTSAVTACLVFLGGVLSFGLRFVVGGADSLGIGRAIIGSLLFTMYAFILGFFFLIAVLAYVVMAVGAGGISGYLLARVFIGLSRDVFSYNS